MTTTPFMQLYVGDYLADTLDLTTEEHGAYLLLLMTMWRHGAELPNDARKLARIARVSPRRWHMIWENIGHFFYDDGGKIRNKRLDREHQKAVSISEKRSVSGSKGGSAKALKSNNAQLANASDLLKHSQNSEPDIREEDTNVSLSVPTDPTPANDLSHAVSRFNDAAASAGWSQVQKMTPQRSKQLRARLRECGGLDGWEDALRRAHRSDFLCGRTSNPWTGFGFDWLVKQANFMKLMEGNYENRTGNIGQFSQGRTNRPDAAAEQISRLA